MGLKGKLIIETEINGSAEKYYSIMKEEAHHFSNIAPDKVSSVELHEGDWHEHGAVKIWTYTINGKTETIKEQISHDDENMSVTLTAVGGDALEMLKSYRGIFQAVPGGAGDNNKDLVKITVEYEKYKESDPAPVHYLEFLINLFIEDFDAHLTNSI